MRKRPQGRPGLHAALAAFRALRRLSPEDVARAARLKPHVVLDYEQGLLIPQPATLRRLAHALRVTIPLLEAVADLLAPYAELTLQGGSTAAGATRSAVRLARILETSLGKQLEALPGQPHPSAWEAAEVERRIAPWLWDRLKPLAPEQRRTQVRQSPEFHSWGLASFCAT